MRRISGAVRPCQSCTISILRSFTALSVSSPPSSRWTGRARRELPSNTTNQGLRRYIHTDTNDLDSRQTALDHQTQEVSEEISEEELEKAPEASDQSVLPWYLRDENAQQPLRNDFNRKQLPPLPANSPNLLQPLLHHVYEELGIDDLVLQDLRNVRPAPALGSNLLMVIGTARSEKHLHISADRLCRWLRTNYKLKPFADGLLGRNELKIKLRRKARRAKLMSAAGGKESSNTDDGIRTGWVCVNIGRVDSGESDSVEEMIPNFIGFGRRFEGTQIVVQMLTEAKREEIDLEGLWSPIIEHSKKTQANDLENNPDTVLPGVKSTGSTQTTKNGSTVLETGASRSFSMEPVTKRQTRGLHTSSNLSGSHLLTRIYGDFDGWETLSTNRQEQVDSLQNQKSPTKARAKIDLEIQEAIRNGDYKHVRRTLLQPGKKPELGLTDDDSKSLMLRALLVHLKSLPNGEALKSLGLGSNDFASTQFLLSFYQTLPAFASDDHWHAKLAMICYARQIGHPGYKGSAIANVVRQMQLSAVPITEEAYFLALETILGPWTSIDEPRRLPEKHAPETSEERLDAVLMVMETMSLQQPRLISEETIVRLVRSMPVSETQIQSDPSPTIPGCSATSNDLEQKRIIDLMRLYGAKVLKDSTWLELFFLYSERKQWTAFWDLWYQRARLGWRRSNEFYSVMFALIAVSGHQAACMDVLRTWVPAMADENPPMKPDAGTKRAIRECILTADPEVPEKLKRDPACNDEWVVAWRKTLGR